MKAKFTLACRRLLLPAMGLLLMISPAVNAQKTEFKEKTAFHAPVSSFLLQPSSAAPVPVLQQGHCGRILSMAFSPDRSLLATAGQDGTGRIWDLKSEQLLLTLGHGAPVIRVAFSGDGHSVITQSVNHLRFWNTQSGRQIGQTAAVPSSYATFAAGGNFVSAFTFQNQVQVWDTRTGTLSATHQWKPEAQQKYGRPLAFLPDGKNLLFEREELEEADQNANASGTPRRYKLVTFHLVDGETGEAVRALQSFELRAEQGYSAFLTFPPDGSAFALATGDGGVRLWNLRTGKMLPVLKGSDLPVSSLAFSFDGKKLATGSNQGRKETANDVFVWDVTTGKRIATLPGKPDVPVRALSFDRTGQTLAVAAPNWRDSKNNKGVHLWDVTTGRERLQTEGGLETEGLGFSPDNALLIGSDGDGELRFWERQTGRQTATLAAARSLFYPTYSPDGSLAAVVAFNGYMQIWDTHTGKLHDNFPTNPQFGPRDRYLETEPVFSPDGQGIAFALSHRGPVDWYDLKTRQKRRLYAPEGQNPAQAERLVFAPDGKTLAVGMNDAKTRLINVADGRVLTTLDGEFNLNGSHEWLARFTSDGKTFVGMLNNEIRFFDLPGGKLRKTLTPARSQSSLAMSSDGSLLALMLDREVQLIDVATGMVKSTLRITDGEYLYNVLLSPDAKLMLTRGVQRLRIWDVATGQVVAVLTAGAQGSETTFEYNFRPIDLTFSGDSRGIAARLQTGQVLAWDVQNGKRIVVTTGEQLAAFPPMFQRPLSIEGASLVIHDPRGGSPLALLTALPALTPEEQRTVMEHPDNKVLANRPFAWIAQTPNGNYAASDNIGQFLRWNVNGVLESGDRYAAQFHHPELVQKALRLELPAAGGAASAPTTARDSLWVFSTDQGPGF